jgi:hypothetical protein
MPGWKGEPIQNLATSPFVDHNAMAGVSDQVLAIGLTKDAGINFVPAVTPKSCLVQMHEGDTLYVSGMLHVPGKSQPPYIVNLSCKLN